VTAARAGRTVVALGVGLWVAGLFVAPGALFPLGHFICHQRPERSFFIGSQQLPVCARCTGLYVGAAIAAPFAVTLAAAFASSRARWILGLAALPTAITWILEVAGLVPFSNVSRFVAALPLGFAAAWLVLSTIGDDRASH
jgi:uncharacterized membrane protein